jgi:hypothetical protein
MQSSEFPVQYTHSVKIEDTSKGIRISIHIYSNDLQTAVNEAMKLNLAAKQKAEKGKDPCYSN